MRYITGAGSFMLYSFLRAFALFSDPTKLHGVVPSVDLAGNADAEAAQILSAYARAVSVLLFASGLVAGYGGNKGRLLSFAVIFVMFFVNHIVDGQAYPPVVPVVAANVVSLLCNIYESMNGGSIGKYSYVAMQGLFGLLFLAEPAFLVQDPFTFAVEGTDALVVGQKLGFVIGMILICHALLAFFEAPASSNDQRTTQPVGCIGAMLVILGGMAKMTAVEGIVLPPVSLGAAGICLTACVYDHFTAEKKDAKKE